MGFQGDIIPRQAHVGRFAPGAGGGRAQIASVQFIVREGRITNKQYRELSPMSDEAARREQNELIEKGLLRREGSGRSVFYIIVGAAS